VGAGPAAGEHHGAAAGQVVAQARDLERRPRRLAGEQERGVVDDRARRGGAHQSWITDLWRKPRSILATSSRPLVLDFMSTLDWVVSTSTFHHSPLLLITLTRQPTGSSASSVLLPSPVSRTSDLWSSFAITVPTAWIGSWARAAPSPW